MVLLVAEPQGAVKYMTIFMTKYKLRFSQLFGRLPEDLPPRTRDDRFLR